MLFIQEGRPSKTIPEWREREIDEEREMKREGGRER